MKNIILYISALLIITSCATRQRCNEKFPPQIVKRDSVVIRDSTHIIDSIRYVTITKDSTIYTKAVKDSGEIDVTEGGTYKFNNGVVQVELNVKNGKAKWKVNVASTESKYIHRIDSMSKIIDTYKQKDSTSVKEIETTKIIDNTKKLKWYDKLWLSVKDFFAWLGVIFLLIFILRRLFLKSVDFLSS